MSNYDPVLVMIETSQEAIRNLAKELQNQKKSSAILLARIEALEEQIRTYRI